MIPPDPDEIIAAAIGEPRLIGLIDEIRAHQHTQGRLFQTRWAPTATPCVLKVGLGELEAQWMPAISAASTDIVPTVRAHGDSLGGLDLDWMIMDDHPIRARSDVPDTPRAVMATAARFQHEALALDLPTYPIDAEFVQQHAALATAAACPGPTVEVAQRIETDDAWLRSLGPYVKGHGDVHFWNAVSSAPDGPWLLIDPIPRTAHWAWDAAYAQMTSGVAETPDLVGLLAEERDRLHLAGPRVGQLEQIRTILLGWSSMMWWAILPTRRTDQWWAGEVRRHVTALAGLPS